jgi:hypothetical protein
MAKMKMVLSWSIPIVLVSAALLTPIIAQAGSIKIWPDQLKATDPGCVYYQDATSLGAEGCDFTAAVTLPVGARITKITYYRILYPAAITSLSLERIKMGNLSNTLAEGEGSISVVEDIEAVDVPFTVEPPGDPVIRSGYRYYIRVWSGGSAQFRGAKIDYRQ